MIRVCPLSALPRGEALRVGAEPPIAVFHTEGGEVFAIDDTCTHQDASLADGWVEGCEVECPLRGRSHRVEHWTGALERPLTAVASLLSGSASSGTVSRATNIPYFWSDQYDVRIQFAGHAADADSVTVEEGSAESRDVLAVYRRGDEPVAVLGMNQARPFTRWRRQLNAAPVPA